MSKQQTIGLVLLVAGSGKRMNTDKNKILLKIDDKPLFVHALKAFIKSAVIDSFVIVCKPDEEAAIKEAADMTGITYVLAYGGKERQDSVYNGLLALKNKADYVMVHDGARPFIPVEVIQACADALLSHGSGVAGIPVHDTIKRIDNDIITETLNRDELVSIQTPQCFDYKTLMQAHEKAQTDGFIGTDEAVLVERLNKPVYWVNSTPKNRKITTTADLEERKDNLIIGHGMDVHAFAENRKLIIGGVTIPYSKGLLGHSDADVLTHAVMDALLGAAGLPDIGQLFPDSDNGFKGADSLVLLDIVYQKISQQGFSINNIDCTLVMQAPKIAPYVQEIRNTLSSRLNLSSNQLNLKATTTEHLGFTGRGEGAAAFAVCLLIQSRCS